MGKLDRRLEQINDEEDELKRRYAELAQTQSGPGSADIILRQMIAEAPPTNTIMNSIAKQMPAPVTPMPVAGDELKKATQRKRAAQRRQTSGRLSTILSGYGEDTLG